MGDSRSTWTNSQTNAFWPELLTKDNTFDGYNIFVYGFPSPALGKSYSIDEAAEDLRLILDSNDVSKQDELVFLAHSMGGLITRAYLSKYREIAGKVRFICFYSTPTTGSEIAKLSRLASQNPQLKQMVSMTSDSFLADQQRQWLAAGHQTIPSYCAYELLETYGEKIVEQQSATNLCNKRLDPVDANHIDIVKPSDENDKPYLIFKSAFKESMPPSSFPSLQGTVIDQSTEKGIQGALVTIDEMPGMKPAETSTDGVFSISGIPKKYGDGVRVRVTKDDYLPNPYTEDVVLGKAPPRIKLRRQ